MRETDLQRRCLGWFEESYPEYYPLLLHIPNEATYKAAKFYRSIGVKKGAPDLLLLLKNNTYGYLAIELKVGYNKQTPEQVSWEDAINDTGGGRYRVCKSLEDFQYTVNAYLANGGVEPQY